MKTLTKRETEILRLIVDELTTEQIAAQLYVSVRTVETHRKNMAVKIGSSSLVAFTKYAIIHRIARIGSDRTAKTEKDAIKLHL